MREIRLYGELGKQYGRVHRLAVSSVGEAIRALAANFPGFEAEFLRISKHYRIWTGRDAVPEAERINDPSGAAEIIRIAPVVAGAKSGFFQVLVGAAIIGAAFLTGGASLVGTGGLLGMGTLATTALGSFAVSVGASLMLGGVAQMLSPTPPTPEAAQGVQNNPSYSFNGAVNTTVQGVPVPIGYGRLIVGSAVISGGLFTQDNY